MGELFWEERLAAGLSSVPRRLTAVQAAENRSGRVCGGYIAENAISPPDPFLGPVLGDAVGRAGCRGLPAEE